MDFAVSHFTDNVTWTPDTDDGDDAEDYPVSGINVKKSSYIQIGHRCNVTCARNTTCHGQPLQWVSEFRYLGVFIVSSRFSNVHLCKLNVFFYAAANGLFGKFLNLASEEVILKFVGTVHVYVATSLVNKDEYYSNIFADLLTAVSMPHCRTTWRSYGDHGLL